jgi:hypothetical protein
MVGKQGGEISENKFYFCTKHHAVEGPDGCGPMDRLGPYPTKERNEEWDNDPNWNDAGPGSGPVDR